MSNMCDVAAATRCIRLQGDSFDFVEHKSKERKRETCVRVPRYEYAAANLPGSGIIIKYALVNLVGFWQR